MYDAVLAVKEETGCNPLLVGLSFGGLTAYTAFTRYGPALADNVHAVLYAVAPFTPLAAGAGGTRVACWLSSSLLLNHPPFGCWGSFGTARSGRTLQTTPETKKTYCRKRTSSQVR